SYFPQVAVGGGYSTLFSITNTGAIAASGTLILTDQRGNPFTVRAESGDQPSFPLTVPPGGSTFLTANPVTAGDPKTVTGWARLESLGQSLTALATFRYVAGGTVQTIAGVFQSQPVRFATIPVDNDDTQDQFTGYAIANPSTESITVKLALVDQNGAVVDDTVTFTLGPGQQRARFLHQDLDRLRFRGSMVLRGQGGKTFVAVALLQRLGRLTVIPVTPEKAAGVPD
ncbi:MAG: hypothetical protein DMG07_14720, partial [Acidobacteria bacterium]